MVKVVVVGGSTVLGTLLRAELEGRGHEAAWVDAVGPGGVGVEAPVAFAGAGAVVDVSECTSTAGPDVRADVEASVRAVLAAAREAAVAHVVLASTVGVGRLFASEHFLARIAAELLVERSAIPYSIVRTTQLFESLPALADAAGSSGATVRVARVLVEPIAAGDVAAELATTALGPAAGAVTALAGPEPFHLDDLVRWVLEARADGRAVVTDPHAPFFGAELEEHALVPAGAARHTTTRFADWLTATSQGAHHG